MQCKFALFYFQAIIFFAITMNMLNALCAFAPNILHLPLGTSTVLLAHLPSQTTSFPQSRDKLL